MDFALTPDQQRLYDEIVRFARENLNAGAAERDRTHTFSRDLWKRCGAMGLPGLCVPEEFGGVGLDPPTTAVALEALGYGCEDGGLSFSICAHLLACVVPIVHHGTEAQKRKFLPGLADGTLIAANAMSEPGSGSDAYAMKTRAVRDGDGWRLNGTKMWTTNGPVADVVVVYAVTDAEKGYFGGISIFLLESGTPGLGAGQTFEKMGLRSSPIGEVVLEDVRVPADSLLGGEGAGTIAFTQSMEWERVCIAAKHVGTMRRLLEKSIQYARTREAFGVKIGKHQAVAHKIVDMRIRLEAARLLVHKAAAGLDRARDVALDASSVKVFASEALVQTALDTVQIFGGNGFMTEFEVERTLRDAIGSKIYSGTNEIQRNIIAKWLGL
jgi:alkylation response protein AidB-like acyl-CoA dehydrogenase